MTRTRLRARMSQDEFDTTYAVPHDASRFADHALRVSETIRFIREQVGPVTIAADLSCGNGAIIDGIEADVRIKGDYAPGYEIVGPIEQTLPALGHVDLLICSETVEHLDDPDSVIATARGRASHICVTTPLNETAWHNNPEHYWAWGLDDVSAMLTAGGFTNQRCLIVPTGFYTFQIWVAS